MKLTDLKDKRIHFIGIGGIGMSGIALILAQRGYAISGSDLAFNANTERLKKEGVSLVLGHDSGTISGKEIIVVSTDIKENNPELKEARLCALPILHRSEMLALLMEGSQGIAISGTHGKTTTTALMGWTLETAGLDPTIINGGEMNTWGSNVKMGQGKWCVVEADESDGSFLKLPRKMAIVTNIDLDHMDYYGSVEKLYSAFETFTTHLHFGGIAILGIDHPQVYSLWKRIKADQKCITYGVHPEAMIRAENIQMTPDGALFDLIQGDQRSEIFLSLYGPHNVLNALGVAAVSFECGIEVEVLKRAFSTFEGIQRRFTRVGDWEGITIIDDYAHHPVEIRATLKAAQGVTNGRVIAVLEPHRYTRLTHHFEEFVTCCEGADVTIVLPVYAARETPQEGINHERLVKAMKGEVYRCDEHATLPRLIQTLACAGDMIVCLGAGSISSLARALPMQLNQSNACVSI